MMKRELVTKLEPGRYMLTYGEEEVCLYRLPGIMPVDASTPLKRTEDQPISRAERVRLHLLERHRSAELTMPRTDEP